MAYTTVSVALIFVITVGVAMSQSLPRDQQTQLDYTVREVMKCADIPSLSLAFTSTNQKITYARGFELNTTSSKRSVSAQSVFCIGGATQAFTAVLLAKLLYKHPNVTWDTPLRDIVNHDIQLPDRYISDNLNLKDIFAMRSGLAGMEIVTVARPFSVDELVRNLRYAPPVAGFREKTIHNEVLFSLVEEVVKVLGGETWQSLIRQHILQPLQMASTTFIGPASQNNQDLVKGAVNYNSKPYYLEAESYSGLELAAPAASMCTSADDMVRWFNFLLNGGKVDNQVIVEQAALEATYETIQPRGKNADPVLQNFREANVAANYFREGSSLGWINGFYKGYPFVSQDGSVPGYQTLATIVPSLNVSVYVAFNGDHEDKRVAAKVMLNMLGIDFFIRDKPLLAVTEMCRLINHASDAGKRRRQEETQETIQRTSTQVPRPLREYIGTYKNYAYGDVRVKAPTTEDASRDSGLVLVYGLAEYKLITTNKNNTFQLIVPTGSLWYSTNTDWYRNYEKIYAEFFSDSAEEDEPRFTSIKIDGFDRHHTPEFSINAQPPRYDRYSYYITCSASVLSAWQWTVLLVTTIMHFS